MCSQWLAIKLTCITHVKKIRIAWRYGPKTESSEIEILDLQENRKAQKFSKGAFW